MGRLLAAVVALWVVEARAEAGVWYYTWVCAGACAPNQLDIRGVEGPFSSYDECNSVRFRDDRRNWVNGPGSAGNVSSCEETDGAPPVAGGVSGGGRVARVQLWQLGLSVGSGWRTREAGGAPEGHGDATIGLDLDIHFGRPSVGLELVTGVQGSRVESAVLGPDPRSFFVIPLYLGFVLTPFSFGQRIEVRPELSIAGGFLFANCAGCSDQAPAGVGLGWHVKAGVIVYFGRRGFSLDAIIPFEKIGNIADELAPDAVELRSPRVLVRVSLVSRRD